jgi:hypothetical protein
MSPKVHIVHGYLQLARSACVPVYLCVRPLYVRPFAYQVGKTGREEPFNHENRHANRIEESREEIKSWPQKRRDINLTVREVYLSRA